MTDSAPQTGNVIDLPSRPPGRPKGARNRRNILGEEYLRTLNPKAKKRLRKIIDGDDAELALKAASLVLSYSFGKPVERAINANANINVVDVDDREFARMVAFMLEKGARLPEGTDEHRP